MREPRKERPDPVPGTVTATSVQVRDSNRMSVFVDGRFSFGMPLDAAVELGVRKGLDLDRDLLDRCLAADESYRARQRALSLLAHRARSTGELRRRLAMAGFRPEAVNAALERMNQLGYLDDESFARSFVQERLLSGRHGRRRVMADLRKKGINQRLAQEILAETADEHNEAEDALAAAARRARLLPHGLDPRKARQRLYGHLARRGFSPDAIRHALDRLGTEGVQRS